MSGNSLSPPINPTAQSPLEQLLAAYRTHQSRPLEALRQQQKRWQERQKLLTSLRTQIEELFHRASSLTLSNASELFAARKVQSSAPEVVRAAAQNATPLGSISIQVQRLASNDVLLSDRLQRADPFGLSGMYRFTIASGGTTAEVSVSLTGTENTETALRTIASAINSTADIGVIATVVLDTPATVRLMLTAKQTGSDAAITFSDIQGLLAHLGWDENLFRDSESRTIVSSTRAGYQFARASELNAQLTLNGLTVIRLSNTISDLLPGITLTLGRSQSPTEPPVVLTTMADTDRVATLIQGILDAYNTALRSLSSALDGNLKGSPALNQLYNQLRLLSSQSLGNGPLRTLRDIGITVNQDGTLTISDRSQLEQELLRDSNRVAALFTSAGGLGEQLVSTLRDVVGSTGTLRSQWEISQQQLLILDRRIRQLEQRINARVEQYRKEYIKLQQLYAMATSQLSMLNNFVLASTGMFSNTS